MKPISLTSVITFVFAFFFCSKIQAQTFGISSSSVWISDCNQDNYYNTSGSIGPAANVFSGANLGTHTLNSGTLILRGGEVRSFKSASGNVCAAHLYYRIYPQSGLPGSFNIIDLSLADNCDVPTSQFPSGGSCAAGDQKWNLVIPDGTTTPYSPIDLTTFPAGNYVLEVYYDVTGSSVNTSLCDEAFTLNNSTSNYKATFSIQSPTLASANPTTCNGSEGFITISGLTAEATYAVSYSDDGNPVGPNNRTANGSGQIIISGLNAGIYSDFDLTVNGCTTNLSTGLILSNPVIIPKFNKIPAFCAGTTAPSLPATSTNGITGTWNPAVINNTTSGAYTFTPNPNQCGIPATINVTVTPRSTPIFSFGTSRVICAGQPVPVLPATSTNGIVGTWSPSVVSDQNSATYVFTPTSGQCANGTSFTVTVNPNITPSFSFGTTKTICAGDAVPGLPTTSDNGITGTWNPSVVSNQTSGSYVFTPDANQCATSATFNVTVNPLVTPTFSFGPSLSICSGNAVPSLPLTSNNGINGTWNPSVVDNSTSGTYTFIPSTGCALPFTLSVNIDQKITPTFSFPSSITICAGQPVPVLPSSSTNSITGSWSSATVDAQNSATYTFTPGTNQCATPATLTVTVNPNITPIFGFGTSMTICAGANVPDLPSVSDNGIAGTWNNATIDKQNSGTYTFTPDANQCAVPAILTVTVNPIVNPVFSFGNTLPICAGASVPALPSTSNNGVAGIWSTSAIDNQASGTYTFTPVDPCAIPFVLTVTVAPNITPTFSFPMTISICDNGVVPVLPTTSANGITGTWSSVIVNNHTSGSYIFTPDAGQCAVSATLTVTVSQIVTPVFGFGTATTICANASVPSLPAISDNGITGTWNPSVVDNQNSGTYIFTPASGQCANGTSFTVTVNPNITPVFSFGVSKTICAGDAVPSLPLVSDNSITGTWSPSVVDDQASSTYVFTPDGSQCATPFILQVTVNSKLTPSFNFSASFSICEGSAPPSLPAMSNNNISGSWNPAVISNTSSCSYTFTPDAGQCALPLTISVTVNANVVPTFSFMPTLNICAGNTVPALPTTSDNGIAGSWSPASINNQASGTYTFTPDAGQCANSVNFTVTVTQNTVPTFSLGKSLVICAGDIVPTLPPASTNGLTGSWSPATVSNQTSAEYTFTPDATPGQCLASTNFIVTVNQKVTPTFNFSSTLTICTGANVPNLSTTSANGITGTWAPAAISKQTSGTYTFTPDASQCVASNFTLSVTVTQVATVDFESDTTVNDGTTIPANNLTGTPSGVSFSWTNSNTAIGLGASGTGNIPSFIATNKGSAVIAGTITVVPNINGCAGTVRSYNVKVISLDKDVFVPNVFSPNGDGKNDILYAYSNYIDKLEMRIFNQWGQQIVLITDPHKGWDGKYKGTPQPVGVYMYALKATMTDGRTIQLKGNITLVR